MAKAIEILMHEHRIIEQVLGSLETFVDKLQEGIEDERSTLRDYVSFFLDFVDKCHHAKEEDHLFPRMIGYGFTRESGPVAVMLANHGEGRERLEILATIAEGFRVFTREERQKVREIVGSYIPFQRADMEMEETLLYPMAMQALPVSVMEELAFEFEVSGRTVMAPGSCEKYYALAKHLVAVYPPAPKKMSSATQYHSRGGMS